MHRMWYRSTVDCSDAVDWDKFNELYDTSQEPYVPRESVEERFGVQRYPYPPKESSFFIAMRDNHLLRKEWLYQLKHFGLKPQPLRVFSRSGGAYPHIDGYRRAAALNWVVHAQNDKQRWFAETLPKYQLGKDSPEVDVSTLTLVDEVVVDRPTVVCINKLHDVVQPEPAFRLCFSLVVSEDNEAWDSFILRSLKTGFITQ